MRSIIDVRNIGDSMRKNKGNTMITTPIILAIGILFVSGLIVVGVKILTPYIWYEKLSSTCIKYIFVMEEYGYLTKTEASKLKQELVDGGFNNNKLNIGYTASRVSYGNPIFLKVSYQYEMKLPFIDEYYVPMEITRNSVSKR